MHARRPGRALPASASTPRRAPWFLSRRSLLFNPWLLEPKLGTAQLPLSPRSGPWRA